MPDPQQTLQAIREHLSVPTAPEEVIRAFVPPSRSEALAWARRLPLWDEYRAAFGPQVVALARVISRLGMRRHGLAIDRGGAVVEERDGQRGAPPPMPARRFSFRVNGAEVVAEYTPDYFPASGQAHFQFRSPHDPPQPTPLSPSGFWSHFCLRDAVTAVGGPEAYAALYAAAKLQGQEQKFLAGFEGERPESAPRRRKPVPARATATPEDATSNQESAAGPAVGPHSARVIAGRAAPQQPGDKPKQPTLF
jgi:hypothetical protein